MRLKTLRNISWAWMWRYALKHGRIHAHYYISTLSRRSYWPASIDGVTVKLGWVHPYQHLYAYIESRNLHEYDMLLLWERLAKDARVIIDAGSYNGMYGLVAAAANPHAQVMMFEANPTLAEGIRHNIELNNFPNITFFPQALSDRIGTERFKVDAGGSAGTLSDNGVEVPATTLTANGMPDLIKLDIVGAEYKVLHAAQEYLRQHSVTILLELYPENKEVLLPLLKELGYQTKFLRPRSDGGVEYYLVFKS